MERARAAGGSYNWLVTSAWADAADDERNVAWTRAFADAMKPHAAPAVYVNYTSDQDRDMMKSAYLPSAQARLQALKKTYDPTNLFRMNHNIDPGNV